MRKPGEQSGTTRSWPRARLAGAAAALALALAVGIGAVVGLGGATGPEEAVDPGATPSLVEQSPSTSAITPPIITPPTTKGSRSEGRRSDRAKERRKPARSSDLASRVEALADARKAAKRRRTPLATPTLGRSGSGLVLGALDPVVAPVGDPVTGSLSTSVANLPNRTSAAGFAASLRAITAEGQDFVLLNEVSARDLGAMRAIAPAYGAYRDPVRDVTQGGSQSMNNVILWRADRWNLVDAGRVKVVDDDRGYRQGSAFVWDRYVTWATFQRPTDRAVVSVVSTHLPTNPVRYPAQPAGSSLSRVERYSRGMDLVVATVRTLSRFGPVLMGGDMNSHPYEGAWTAAQKMTAAGFGYVKDRAVMYLFYPPGVRVLAHREVRVDSDHPAIVTTLDMGGAGPTG